MLSEDKILQREREIERERETAPLVSLLRYPHPSQEQLIERSHILLDFCLLFFLYLVPGSSSVFTNVSIDHGLHLMEGVFAA